MRKLNHILARIIIALFLLHALMGSLMLLGISEVTFAPFSWVLFTTVIAHGVLGILSSVQTLKSGKKSSKWYLKQNAGFYTKRISGIAILILIMFHINAYTTSIHGHFFLKEFTLCKMILQILLILAIFLHLAVSIKSMLIAKGVIKFKEKTIDWMLVLSVMIIFFIVAVIAYYIQWQV